MESFENWLENIPLYPQELSFLQNCSIMTLNPKTFGTNFPAGWEGKGRNGLQQLGCTSDGRLLSLYSIPSAPWPNAPLLSGHFPANDGPGIDSS